MAGYIMNLDSTESLERCIMNGIYSTRISPPRHNNWQTHQEGTFADYATMKPGDNIYFFIQRKIYGIGELVSVEGDCKYKNYPDSDRPQTFEYRNVQNSLLLGESEESVSQRWVCLFKPSPLFFRNGVDMDEVLTSNPSKFRMLRAFWKLSFVKVDDDENQAMLDIILKSNEDVLDTVTDATVFNSDYINIHNRVAARIRPDYRLTASGILSACSDGERLRHEMALEAGLLYQLACNEADTVGVFGNFDYLTHQVIASPFKPIDYMDKMDVFGYKFIRNYKTRSKYLVAELKVDTANTQDIDQLMKYVDWVNEEYAFDDYSMINAFLVTYDFPAEVVAYAREAGSRRYTIGKRPAQSREWTNLALVTYRFDAVNGKLVFRVI